MTLPILAQTSLKLNGKDVTTEYGFFVREIKGLEAIAPGKVLRETLAGSGSVTVGDPETNARVLTISGQIASDVSQTDLNQKLAALAAQLGRTTYGFRTLHVEIIQPAIQFEGVYGGSFTVVYEGARMVAQSAQISFTVVVKRVEAETVPSEIASGSLDSTDKTLVYLRPDADKGASWQPLAVFDEAQIAIKSTNAVNVTAVDLSGFFQKRFEKITAVSSGVIKYDEGHDAHTGSVKWAAGDTHTVKYPVVDGTFFPTSTEFQIFIRFKPRFVIASEVAERVLFSCSNASDANRTKIILTTDKKIQLKTGGQTVTSGAYDVTPSIVIGQWAYLRARLGNFGTEIFLNDDAGATGVSATTGTQFVSFDPSTHFFIGSNPDGTSPCKCDIGEIAILGTSGFDIGNITPTDPPVMDNNRTRATEWLSFATDFRAALGLDGVSRGNREINGLDAGGLLQQNEEIFLDLDRRRAFRVDHDDMDSGRGGEVTDKFTGEWPTIGDLSTIQISTTPKQASMTYRVIARARAVE